MRKTSFVLFLCFAFVLSAYSSDCNLWFYNVLPKDFNYDDPTGVNLTFQSYNGLEGLQVQAPFSSQNPQLTAFEFLRAEGCANCVMKCSGQEFLYYVVKSINLFEADFSLPELCLSKFELNCLPYQEWEDLPEEESHADDEEYEEEYEEESHDDDEEKKEEGKNEEGEEHGYEEENREEEHPVEEENEDNGELIVEEK